jgi:hypothetical protein
VVSMGQQAQLLQRPLVSAWLISFCCFSNWLLGDCCPGDAQVWIWRLGTPNKWKRWWRWWFNW